MRSIACVAAKCVVPPFSYRDCVNFAPVLVKGQSPPLCRDCTDFVPIPDAGLSLIEPFLDEGRPENAGVLAHFRRRNERRHPLAAWPADVPDAYLSLGSHPDIVERVWNALGPGASWRLVVLGTPALVDPEAGTVLAVALGTSYWLRLTRDDLAVALAAGARQTHRYGLDPNDFDASETFGATWVHGSWDEREPGWVLATSTADRVS